jgi:putative transposase
VPLFHDADLVRLVGTILRESRERWPVVTKAIVVLPDHLHVIWCLPSGDDRYSMRWAWIKKEFTKRHLAMGGQEQVISDSKKRSRRRGVWQRRFWEHTIEDERDYEAHFDYIHWNPVKHGYVSCPHDWPHTSFHTWVAKGVYERNWGCGHRSPKTILKINDAGE